MEAISSLKKIALLTGVTGGIVLGESQFSEVQASTGLPWQHLVWTTCVDPVSKAVVSYGAVCLAGHGGCTANRCPAPSEPQIP